MRNASRIAGSRTNGTTKNAATKPIASPSTTATDPATMRNTRCPRERGGGRSSVAGVMRSLPSIRMTDGEVELEPVVTVHGRAEISGRFETYRPERRTDQQPATQRHFDLVETHVVVVGPDLTGVHEERNAHRHAQDLGHRLSQADAGQHHHLAADRLVPAVDGSEAMALVAAHRG